MSREEAAPRKKRISVKVGVGRGPSWQQRSTPDYPPRARHTNGAPTSYRWTGLRCRATWRIARVAHRCCRGADKVRRPSLSPCGDATAAKPSPTAPSTRSVDLDREGALAAEFVPVRARTAGGSYSGSRTRLPGHACYTDVTNSARMYARRIVARMRSDMPHA